MKNQFGVLAALMCLAGQSAWASCFNQCVMWNPVNGNCVANTRICNLGSPTEMRETLQQGLRRGRVRLPNEIVSINPNIGKALASFSMPTAQQLYCPLVTIVTGIKVYACIDGVATACPQALVGSAAVMQCLLDAVSTEEDRAAFIRTSNNPLFAGRISASVVEEARSQVARIASGRQQLDDYLQLDSVVEETFEKRAMNTTCDDSCKAGVISVKGQCVGAVRLSDNRNISCATIDTSRGRPGLACQCARPTVKSGNTRGLSCRQYCAGEQFGRFSGACVAGQVLNGSSLTCDQAARPGQNVSCACLPY